MRAANLAVTRLCEQCGGAFSSGTAESRTCTRRCAQLLRHAHVTAGDRRERQLERWRRKNRRRRGLDVLSDAYTLAEIAERDGFKCGLCGASVDMSLVNPEPMAATIDHVVPISISRDDTRANVQLAHRTCNIAKGTRVDEAQLAA